MKRTDPAPFVSCVQPQARKPVNSGRSARRSEVTQRGRSVPFARLLVLTRAPSRLQSPGPPWSARGSARTRRAASCFARLLHGRRPLVGDDLPPGWSSRDHFRPSSDSRVRANTCCSVIVRSGRPRPRNAMAQPTSVATRFLKPVRNARWTTSQSSQATAPPTRVDHGHVDGARRRAFAAAKPPKPEPTMATRCLRFDVLMVILAGCVEPSRCRVIE